MRVASGAGESPEPISGSRTTSISVGRPLSSSVPMDAAKSRSAPCRQDLILSMREPWYSSNGKASTRWTRCVDQGPRSCRTMGASRSNLISAMATRPGPKAVRI